MIFEQDNAKPHTAKGARAKITELSWTTMEHPLYSPDLALCDFHLFRSLQNYFSGSELVSAEGSQNEVNSFLASRSPDFLKNGIFKLINRWKGVISNDGEYLDD